tara:strand:- start:98 stop:937 length:840 start_codon:yes stop_codon:yes gene_type:complete
VGLGGYLTWTATFREIQQKVADPRVRIIPVETDNDVVLRVVRSPIFDHNPYITYDINYKFGLRISLNNPAMSYCILDTPRHATHRQGEHIITHMCKQYKIQNPKLKCELYFSDSEQGKVVSLRRDLDLKFIAVEPCTKTSYTPNRAYSFTKWQNIVDELSKSVQVVQLGLKSDYGLRNTTDFRGLTSFKEAALLIGESKAFLSTEGGLVHAATSVETPAVVIITGYQDERMVAYPQNINVNIAKHGPCGLKVRCEECVRDANQHDEGQIIERTKELLSA